MSALKIGFDGSRAFSESKRTGTENYSYYLLKYLARIDHKNQYLIYLRPGSKVADAWPDNFQFKLIDYPRLWTQIGLAIQTFKDDLDVLFVPAHTVPLVHKPGLKTIMTVHDLGAEYLPSLHQLKQALYLRAITKFQLKNATKLIAVSRATRLDLIKNGISEEKIEVVYEGIDLSKFRSPSVKMKKDTLQEYGLVANQYYLFVGTIQPRKNLARLIEAFAFFLSHQIASGRNQQLVLAGKKGWLADEIYTLPDKFGIGPQVKFLDFVPDSKISTLFAGAKAFVYPSLFEGFGLPILEAFAMGCPVITSNTSSIPEVAGDAAILIDPYNIEELAQGLSLVADKSKVAFLNKQAKVQLAKFSWEKCARETLDLLEKVAKK